MAPPPDGALGPVGGRSAVWGRCVRPARCSAPERWAVGPGPEWPERVGRGRGEAAPGLEGRAGGGGRSPRGGAGARGVSPSLPPSFPFFLRFSLSSLFFSSAAGRGGGPCSLCCSQTERSRPPGGSPGPGRRELHAGRACPEPDPGPGSERTGRTRACARGRLAAAWPRPCPAARVPEAPRRCCAPCSCSSRSWRRAPTDLHQVGGCPAPAGRPCHPSPLLQPRFSPFSPLQIPLLPGSAGRGRPPLSWC